MQIESFPGWVLNFCRQVWNGTVKVKNDNLDNEQARWCWRNSFFMHKKQNPDRVSGNYRNPKKDHRCMEDTDFMTFDSKGHPSVGVFSLSEKTLLML